MATLTPPPLVPDESLRPDGSRPRTALPTWSAYVGLVRRSWVLLVVLPLVGLVIGFGVARAKPHTYSATTDVVVYPVPAYVTVDNNTKARTVTIDSDAQLVLGSEVRKQVAQTVGLTEPEVQRGLSVGAVPLSTVLKITFSAGNPADAVRGATAAAQAFLQVRTEAMVALRDSQIDHVADRLRVVQTRLLAEQSANPALGTDDPVLDLYRTLHDRLQNLQNLRAVSAEVIDQAQRPTDPDSVDTEVPVTSGLMIGFLLACMVGWMRDVLRRSRFEPLPQSDHKSTTATGGAAMHLDLPDIINQGVQGGPDEPRPHA